MLETLLAVVTFTSIGRSVWLVADRDPCASRWAALASGSALLLAARLTQILGLAGLVVGIGVCGSAVGLDLITASANRERNARLGRTDEQQSASLFRAARSQTLARRLRGRSWRRYCGVTVRYAKSIECSPQSSSATPSSSFSTMPARSSGGWATNREDNE